LERYTAFTWEDPKGIIPQWKLTINVEDDGHVFLPAGAVGNERMLVLMATMDGVGSRRHGGHYYLPLEWLEENVAGGEYPKYYAKVRQKIAEGIIVPRPELDR
jgi:hypothetical protein